jgi:hypothetical protein
MMLWLLSEATMDLTPDSGSSDPTNRTYVFKWKGDRGYVHRPFLAYPTVIIHSRIVHIQSQPTNEKFLASMPCMSKPKSYLKRMFSYRSKIFREPKSLTSEQVSVWAKVNTKSQQLGKWVIEVANEFSHVKVQRLISPIQATSTPSNCLFP